MQASVFLWWSCRDLCRSLFKSRAYAGVLAAWLYPDAWAAARLAEEFGVPLYVKVHGSDVNRLAPGTTLTRRSLDVVARAERVFCVSRALAARLEELGAPAGKLQVVYNGVDSQVFRPQDPAEARRRVGIPEGARVVLFVGNLKREKGLGELARAFRLLGSDADLLLVVVGEGPFRAELRRLGDELGLGERLRLPGALPADEVSRWMSACAVLCLPSYMEGMPNVVLEALACGAPVVATAVGGVRELAAEVPGLLVVPPRAVEELQAALAAALTAGRQAVATTWPSWAESAAAMAKSMGLCADGQAAPTVRRGDAASRGREGAAWC